MQGARSPGPSLAPTYKSLGEHPSALKKDEALSPHKEDAGPHELGNTPTHKELFELDAGFAGEVASTIDSIPYALSRGASPEIPPRAAPRRPSATESLRMRERERNGSTGERVRTPDTYASRGMTPVSIFNSRAGTPDQGGGGGRDARERGMGHVSPMSAATERTERTVRTQRSFLDLD